MCARLQGFRLEGGWGSETVRQCVCECSGPLPPKPTPGPLLAVRSSSSWIRRALARFEGFSAAGRRLGSEAVRQCVRVLGCRVFMLEGGWGSEAVRQCVRVLGFRVCRLEGEAVRQCVRLLSFRGSAPPTLQPTPLHRCFRQQVRCSDDLRADG